MKLSSFLISAAICLLLLTYSSPAQVIEEWVARYNGPGNGADFARSLAVDDGGNVYVTGNSAGIGTGTNDYATIKYNASGNQIWEARYNGPGNDDDTGYSLALDDSGNVYVTGYSVGIGTDKDYATIKYDASGNEIWVARYNGPGNSYDQAVALALDDGGNVFVTGYSAGIGTGTNDYATIKYDASGNEIWVARYDGPGNGTDLANSLALDNGGNVCVTGRSVGSGTDYDYATIKYDASGTQLWVARYNGPGNGGDFGYSLAVDDGGNVYAAGWSLGINTGTADYATIKYDAAGNQLWVARYNGPGNGSDFPYFLALDDGGNVYVTGNSAPAGSFNYDYATIKYDASGNQLWVASYNGPGNSYDDPRALAVDDGGNVYVTGWSDGTGTFNLDYATIKYDASGNELWVVRYNGPGNGGDTGSSLALDDGGNIYVTGWSSGIGTGAFDYATIKYSQPPLAPDVQVTVTPISPPIQIPASGGSFNFNVAIANNETTPQTFDAWIMVQLPNMSWYGPVLGPLTLTLTPNFTLTRIRTQAVPARAPSGTYTYEARLGVYPDSIWNSDSFTFEKLLTGHGTPVTGWENSGESFDNQMTANPSEFALIRAYPNPFNPTTALSYRLSVNSYVHLQVYDTAGRLVATLVNGRQEAGTHEVTFDGANLPSGIYLARFAAGDWSAVQKLVLMK